MNMNIQLIITEYDNKNAEMQTYLDDIKDIVVSSNAFFEGNCFYENGSLELSQNLYSLQLNLFWCGTPANHNMSLTSHSVDSTNTSANTHICEIGFNAGHSAMLLLLGRDSTTPLRFTIFDIGAHPYTLPCLNYIQSKFSQVNFEYIEGDSAITMPEWIANNNTLVGSYDLVHVDGGHSEYCVSNDMQNADVLLKVNGIIIIHDTNSVIHQYVDSYISSGRYVEIMLIETYKYQHRAIRKIL
jgi:hypothetical protein